MYVCISCRVVATKSSVFNRILRQGNHALHDLASTRRGGRDGQCPESSWTITSAPSAHICMYRAILYFGRDDTSSFRRVLPGRLVMPCSSVVCTVLYVHNVHTCRSYIGTYQWQGSSIYWLETMLLAYQCIIAYLES